MFSEKIHFKYPWRPYQKHLIQNLATHIKDRHLHFIAPPGAGKTVLGLEVIRKLNQPVLILTPSLSIRDQWKERFLETFIEDQVEKEFWKQSISTDIESGSNFIISTYQAFYSKSKDSSKLFQHLTHIQVIALDEAHHLQNSWMKAIQTFKEHQDPITLSLTATPPYDASWREWQAYLQINGPIDAEISLVDLVKSGSLCPHQDYIYHLEPTPQDQKEILKFKALADSEKEYLFHSFAFAEFYSSQDWVLDPTSHELWVLKNINLYLSTLNFLQKINSIKNPSAHEELLKIKLLDIKPCATKDDEPLIQFYISNAPEGEALKKKYTRLGLLAKHHLKFDVNSQRQKVLQKSISRLEAINALVEKESQQLGHNLRLLILTSRIQEEVIQSVEKYELSSTQIAVFPIFENIRRKTSLAIFSSKMAILTGSYTVIPKSALLALQFIENSFQWKTYPYDDQFVMSTTPPNGVSIITQLIQQGEIETTIGTQSLLGEGWDCPAINTLILANEIASYVSTNQMRGRTLRKDPKHPQKAAHIWHLGQFPEKKFHHFLGPYHDLEKTEITTGSDRFEKDNDKVDEWIQHRSHLHNHWKACIAKGTQQIDSIVLPPSPRKPSRFKNRAIKRSLQKLAQAIWETLKELQLIHTQRPAFEVLCKNTLDKNRVYFQNISKQEESLLLQCLEQILQVDNPAPYRIARKYSWWNRLVFDFLPYLPEVIAIPQAFTQNKKSAEAFLKNFNLYVSTGRLLSTRIHKDRRELIRCLYGAKVKYVEYKVREVSWE